MEEVGGSIPPSSTRNSKGSRVFPADSFLFQTPHRFHDEKKREAGDSPPLSFLFWACLLSRECRVDHIFESDIFYVNVSALLSDDGIPRPRNIQNICTACFGSLGSKRVIPCSGDRGVNCPVGVKRHGCRESPLEKRIPHGNSCECHVSGFLGVLDEILTPDESHGAGERISAPATAPASKAPWPIQPRYRGNVWSRGTSSSTISTATPATASEQEKGPHQN